jgi:hypothetical protein
MEKETLLKLRKLAVEINHSMTAFNQILLEEFAKQSDMIDCGGGCKIEKPNLPKRVYDHNEGG